METEHKNKVITAKDETTKGKPDVADTAVEKKKTKQFNFPRENFTVQAVDLDEAMKALEDYKSTKNND